MDLLDLDDITRTAMIAEAEADIHAGRLYLGRRLNTRGQRRWPTALAEALSQGSPDSLAAALRDEGLIAEHETSHRNGTTYDKKVPISAADTLAEGEYIRFYMRAVCIRALAAGSKVRIYRAKTVAAPRPESQAKIGQVVDPAALLDDLRQNIGVETFLGLSRPNSGLCISLM